MADDLPRCDFASDKLVLRINLTLNAEPNAVSPIVQAVMQIARQMKCAAGKEFEIELALQEALANAVVHGCGNDPSKQINCCVACDEARGMLIIIRDPGEGFDPELLPNPVVGQNVFSEHGRGIYLINQMMDKVWFTRGGTQIHMHKSGEQREE